jgi:hypothetical protein
MRNLHMLNRSTVTTIAAGLLIALAPFSAAGETKTPLTPEAQARALVKSYVGQMKPLLMASVSEHGAAGAIDVCASKAPQVAQQLEEASGWEVSRVSLKPRNTERATPDTWERQVLEALAAKARGGAATSELNHGEVVDGRYRYLQGQPVEGLCLLCHGKDIAADVAAAIASRYPADSATGYALGDLRGAISLKAPVR